MSYDLQFQIVDQVIVDFEDHELRHVAKIAAGQVAVADEPTPEEVTALAELLDMLGIRMVE